METSYEHALADLERIGLHVHQRGSPPHHPSLGKEHRVSASVFVGANDEGRSISVVVGGAKIHRLVPLSPSVAVTMVDELLETAKLHAHPRMRHTLEHLLVRLSDAYEQLGLRSLLADPIVFTEAGYCIDSAKLRYEHDHPHHGNEFRFRQGRDHVIKWPR
jgi:hypothetical protein